MSAVATEKPPLRRIDRPEPGRFKIRLAKNGPYVAAVIYWRASQPDRSPILLCKVAGEDRDPFEVWPYLRPVSDREYESLLASMPSNPREPIDLGSSAPLF